ncbi:MAG: 4a-hydroxytetrahydrobiopterin dehydratase [Acidobacteriota bacterium]|nr:4a-hydroxytetrahydrobiopterin dehydratase [Acidobacteriota bacterium]MDH3786010.1 4a-hydroxytetrahydrobiopterin dehydratase [Acidobacteriota bacterium]
MTRPARIPDGDVAERLSELEGWNVEGGQLVRQFTFKDFVAAFSFMTAMALVAEKLDHHPDWSNVYNRVTIRLHTHDVGGLTELDFQFAAHASDLAP